jgi:hypothetical protein
MSPSRHLSLCVFSLESSLLLASPPVSDTERFQMLRVLFVDDESSNVRVGRRYLSMVGVNLHNVVTLSDGGQHLLIGMEVGNSSK